MSKPRKSRTLEATAYHEAGHTVCAIVQSLRFSYVTIKPDVEDTCNGHIFGFHLPRWLEYENETHRAQVYIERSAIQIMSGAIAEMFFTGRNNHTGARSDYSHLYHHLSDHLSADLDYINAYIPLIVYKTRALLLNPYNWCQVRAIASSLLERETLKYREAAAIGTAARRVLVECVEEYMLLSRDLAERRQRSPFKVTEFCEA
jgi:hypothetical protein